MYLPLKIDDIDTSKNITYIHIYTHIYIYTCVCVCVCVCVRLWGCFVFCLSVCLSLRFLKKCAP